LRSYRKKLIAEGSKESEGRGPARISVREKKNGRKEKPPGRKPMKKLEKGGLRLPLGKK